MSDSKSVLLGIVASTKRKTGLKDDATRKKMLSIIKKKLEIQSSSNHYDGCVTDVFVFEMNHDETVKDVHLKHISTFDLDETLPIKVYFFKTVYNWNIADDCETNYEILDNRLSDLIVEKLKEANLQIPENNVFVIEDVFLRRNGNFDFGTTDEEDLMQHYRKMPANAMYQALHRRSVTYVPSEGPSIFSFFKDVVDYDLATVFAFALYFLFAMYDSAMFGASVFLPEWRLLGIHFLGQRSMGYHSLSCDHVRIRKLGNQINEIRKITPKHHSKTLKKSYVYRNVSPKGSADVLSIRESIRLSVVDNPMTVVGFLFELAFTCAVYWIYLNMFSLVSAAVSTVFKIVTIPINTFDGFSRGLLWSDALKVSFSAAYQNFSFNQTFGIVVSLIIFGMMTRSSRFVCIRNNNMVDEKGRNRAKNIVQNNAIVFALFFATSRFVFLFRWLAAIVLTTYRFASNAYRVLCDR